MKKDNEHPAIFLGVADHLEASSSPFPYGPIDVYRLSQHKQHIVYPGVIRNYVWVVLVNTQFVREIDITKWALRIADSNDAELVKIEFTGAETPSDAKEITSDDTGIRFLAVKGSDLTMITFRVDSLVPRPEVYTVQSVLNGKMDPIGMVEFHYKKAPTLTPDQIRAIEADPISVKVIQMILGCKHCPSKLKAYTGIDRLTALEREGCTWQTELPDRFTCACGKTDYSLQYLKESMHGMLLKDFALEHSSLSYVRRYGHTQVKKVVAEFTQLLDRERLEPHIQAYIKEHPILLSRFNAARLFIKPTIVGRFEADFAVVDSRKQLWLIELEKPTLKLFKRDRHPTQALMHAYGQVTDWLEQYSKYPGAILDGLGLDPRDVIAVRGAVIAGRSRDVTHEVLQRHLSNPPYPNIEFMTCDDLGAALLDISKNLV